MHTDIFLIGAGGHGKVVLDALLEQGGAPLLYDADQHKAGKNILGCAITVLPENLTQLAQQGHVAIGDNRTRQGVCQQLLAAQRLLLSVIHSRAVVAASATLGEGVFVAANAVVGPDVIIAEGCIVNHAAVVDHDCRVGRYCHIAPNATLGGAVVIGERVLVGSGAVILPGVSVGNGVTIGAGAVVIANVKEGATVVGVPAR